MCFVLSENTKICLRKSRKSGKIAIKNILDEVLSDISLMFYYVNSPVKIRSHLNTNLNLYATIVAGKLGRVQRNILVLCHETRQ